MAATFPALKQRLSFAYDAQGRRIRKLVEAWDTALNSGAGGWATASDLRFVYDGWNLLTETDALNSGVLVRSHVWGLDLSETIQGAGGVGGLLWTNTPTHTFASSADANGNIVAYINTATLAVAGRADYAAFGETVQQTGVAKDLPFGFSSKYRDAKTGFNYYGLRYYNPSTGRWANRDPIEEAGGLNSYSFINNKSPCLYDVIGAAPGDLYGTHEAALESARAFIYNLAVKDREDGARKIQGLNRGTPDSSDGAVKEWRGDNYLLLWLSDWKELRAPHEIRKNWWLSIAGREHATYVYSVLIDGGMKYSYGPVLIGSMPGQMKFIFGGYTGAVEEPTLLTAERIKNNEYAYSTHRDKVCALKDAIHTHSHIVTGMQTGPEKLSQDDVNYGTSINAKIYAISRSGGLLE